jgi:hydroxymethylpyrimidine pyrophosphatase-like HAD family hydrolase
LYFSNIVQSKSNFTVLYGGWGLPVAYDIESKFTEAALVAVQLADFRNFGHGRHHWFDKQKNTSSIIAIVTPNERKIAEKTLSLIPQEIPKLIIDTNIDSPLASIDLLVKSFHLISAIGDIRKIDPGKPGVPNFGSKLYNLKYSSFYKTKKEIFDNKTIAIIRKAHISSIEELSPIELKTWSDSYSAFIREIEIPQYTSLIFDYDGTLSSSDFDNRYRDELVPEINDVFNNLLIHNIKIGAVTGRGKSIKELLRKSIPQEYWDLIYVGYYNGADVGSLKDDSIPNTTMDSDESLKILSNNLSSEYLVNKKRINLRPFQLTIESNTKTEYDKVKNISCQIILSKNLPVIILESSHSLDIVVRPKVSKLNIITQFFKEEKVLCIGDKGCAPGNDFELLSTPYSLSVDEVSYHPKSCWNLVPSNKKNMDALFFYLNSMKIDKGFFKISINK